MATACVVVTENSDLYKGSNLYVLTKYHLKI
jgi:hypothetical protein